MGGSDSNNGNNGRNRRSGAAGRTGRAAGLWALLVWAGVAQAGAAAWGPAQTPAQTQTQTQAQTPTQTAAQTQLLDHIAATHDAQGRYFAIVDKQAARITVYTGDGRTVATAPVLLGLAVGDDSLPGVGALAGRDIPRPWRTTPAGRFASEPGRNLQGEAIVWVDYDAAVAIHRLRPAPKGERRPQRLQSSTVADNRITLGCVVVAGAFYDRVIAPTLGRHRGVVYVLPEGRGWQTLFAPGALAGGEVMQGHARGS